MASKIRKMFERRAQAFDKYTKAIFDALTPTVIAAIVEVLELTPDEIERLEWHVFRLVDEHLVISGLVTYQAGDTIVADDGNVVELTTETAYILSKIIKIALPMYIVEDCTKDQVVEFLRNLEQEMKNEYDQLYGLDPNIQEMGPEELYDPLLKQEEIPTNDVKFDEEETFKYNELTEEQQAALRLARLSQLGNKGNKIN